MKRPAGILLAIVLAMVLGIGCVEHKMTIVSQPERALVYLNNQELGRTPISRDFVWYGNYDVVLRADGYETLRTHRWIIAPIWEWVPFDLLVDILPIKIVDHHTIAFIMDPATTQPADTSKMLARAIQFRGQLQSSEHTRKPSTQPTSRPTTKPATKPATK